MALTLKELDGSKVPSRVNWLKEGVRPTRYFFEIERERFERNILISIQILTLSRFLQAKKSSVRTCSFIQVSFPRPGKNSVLHTSRTQFNQLGSCEVWRLTQLRSTDFIWSGRGFLHAWPAVKNV